MNSLRVYILLDSQSQSRIQTLTSALELLRDDYRVVPGLDLEWKIGQYPMVGIPWTYYSEDAMGIDKNFIKEKAEAIKKEFGEEYHSICFVVDPANWKVGDFDVRGWNLGGFRPFGMSIQIAYFYFTNPSMYKVLAMEFAHALNDEIYTELGINVNSFLGVDWDEDRIHRKGADGYYLYDYREDYLSIGSLLIETFKRRNVRWEAEQNKAKRHISILEQIRNLYRQIILKLGRVPEAVYEKDIL